jgi:hypothetical protein
MSTHESGAIPSPSKGRRIAIGASTSRGEADHAQDRVQHADQEVHRAARAEHTPIANRIATRYGYDPHGGPEPFLRASRRNTS